MKVLFVASANKGRVRPMIKAQGDSIEKLGVKVEYYGIIGHGLKGYFSNIRKLSDKIRTSNPDIIHANYSFCGFVTALTLTNKPIVVSLMGSDIQTGPIIKSIIRLFYHLIWDLVIVKSLKMKLVMNLSQAHIIPNGVDMGLFKRNDNIELKRKFGFDINKKTILFLADPSRHEKNFELAAIAYEHINQNICNLEVRYNLSHEDVNEILNAADIILLTSKWEGSPNVIKEAMACNRPIVATNVGDIEWMFGDEPGHYLTSFDPKDVASKIENALEFSLEKQQTKGRMRLIELGLDAEIVARKVIAIYRGLL